MTIVRKTVLVLTASILALALVACGAEPTEPPESEAVQAPADAEEACLTPVEEAAVTTEAALDAEAEIGLENAQQVADQLEKEVEADKE